MPPSKPPPDSESNPVNNNDKVRAAISELLKAKANLKDCAQKLEAAKARIGTSRSGFIQTMRALGRKTVLLDGMLYSRVVTSSREADDIEIIEFNGIVL